MPQLAFDENGEPIDLPPTAAGWRVRRMKGTRGAPGLVYGSDGAPLVLPLEMDIEDLRREVGMPGRYKLEAVDDRRRLLEAEPAFVVVPPEPDGEEAAAPAPAGAAAAEPPNAMAVVMEAMRQNAEMARTIVDRFPAMLEASAILLKAADGAGLPAREPRGAERNEDDDDEDDDEDNGHGGRPARASAGSKSSLTDLIVQLVPVLATLARDGKLPNLAEMLDWRKAGKKPAQGAAPKAQTSTSAGGAEKTKTNAKTTPDATPQASAEPTATAEAPADAAADAELPPLSPQAMAHFLAIQAALTPEEAALARAAAAELSPRDVRAWFDELSAMSVPEAAERIRTLLATSKGEPASKQKTTASKQEAA